MDVRDVVKQLPNNLASKMPYTGVQVQGVTVLIVVSFVSLLAVTVLLSVIAVSTFNTRSSPENHLSVRAHVASYFVSLLLCNFLQSLGSIINVVWIKNKGIIFGKTCVLQGALKQTSDIGTAVWTLAIAIHTFFILYLEAKNRAFVLWVTTVGGWLTIATLVILGPATANTSESGPFYDISGYWCWISPRYPTQQITLDYLFMFLAALASFALYTLIFLKLKGCFLPNRWRPQNSSTTLSIGDNSLNDQAIRIAKQMLLYPIAYSVLVTPIAISQIAFWAGHNVTQEVMIFTAAVFLLSGLINAVLFLTTRRILPAESMRIATLFQPVEERSANEDRNSPNTEVSLTAISDSTPVLQSSSDMIVGEHPPPERGRHRSPSSEIILTRRDSIDSFYCVHDEEAAHIPLNESRPSSQVLTSHWSSDESFRQPSVAQPPPKKLLSRVLRLESQR